MQDAHIAMAALSNEHGDWQAPGWLQGVQQAPAAAPPEASSGNDSSSSSSSSSTDGSEEEHASLYSDLSSEVSSSSSSSSRRPRGEPSQAPRFHCQIRLLWHQACRTCRCSRRRGRSLTRPQPQTCCPRGLTRSPSSARKTLRRRRQTGRNGRGLPSCGGWMRSWAGRATSAAHARSCCRCHLANSMHTLGRLHVCSATAACKQSLVQAGGRSSGTKSQGALQSQACEHP